MKLSEYIEAVKKGEIIVGTGGIKSGKIVDRFVILSGDDAQAVAAEGFRLGVFDDDTDWDQALAMVTQELERTANEGKTLNGEPFCRQSGAKRGFRAYP